MPTPTNAAPNGGATDAAAAHVTESVAAAFPQTSTVAGDILARSTRALTSTSSPPPARRGSCPTVSPPSSRRSPDYRRWTPTTGPASTSATPPPGSEPMPGPLTTDAHPDPRRWTTKPAPPGYRERAESELNSPNHAVVGTTTVGPIRRKGSS